jgi:hypothetical protein
MASLETEIMARLDGLAAGRIDPADAADWATGAMAGDDPALEVPANWQALDQLSGADLMSAPGTYLHGQEDFAAWIREYRAKVG